MLRTRFLRLHRLAILGGREKRDRGKSNLKFDDSPLPPAGPSFLPPGQRWAKKEQKEGNGRE